MFANSKLYIEYDVDGSFIANLHKDSSGDNIRDHLEFSVIILETILISDRIIRPQYFKELKQ